jgi:hypothetical protein
MVLANPTDIKSISISSDHRGLYWHSELFLACVPELLQMSRVGQNRINTPYMTVYLVISLPKIPYTHRIYMVLANPTNEPYWHSELFLACIPELLYVSCPWHASLSCCMSAIPSVLECEQSLAHKYQIVLFNTVSV